MAYNLQVRLEWNHGKGDYDYLTLDISLSNMYTPAIQDNSSVCAYQRSADSKKGVSKGQKPKFSLQDIDLFTSQFDSEQKLKDHLNMLGILQRLHIKRRLVIRYNSQIMSPKDYSIIYSNGRKYLNPTKIRNLLNERLLAEDYKFLAHVGSKLKGWHDCAETAATIYNLANYSDVFLRSKGFSRSYDGGLSIIDLLVYTMSYKKKNGFFTTDIDWRKLHVLASVIIERLEFEERERQKALEAASQKSPLKKTRTKPDERKQPTDKDDDDGQISIRSWLSGNN